MGIFYHFHPNATRQKVRGVLSRVECTWCRMVSCSASVSLHRGWLKVGERQIETSACRQRLADRLWPAWRRLREKLRQKQKNTCIHDTSRESWYARTRKGVAHGSVTCAHHGRYARSWKGAPMQGCGACLSNTCMWWHVRDKLNKAHLCKSMAMTHWHVDMMANTWRKAEKAHLCSIVVYDSVTRARNDRYARSWKNYKTPFLWLLLGQHACAHLPLICGLILCCTIVRMCMWFMCACACACTCECLCAYSCVCVCIF